jgi:hypothetical protein
MIAILFSIWVSLITLKVLKVKPFVNISWGILIILPILLFIFNILRHIIMYIIAFVVLFGVIYYICDIATWIYN